MVARGPYRLVRHPAYAGESLMLIGCIAAIGGLAWLWLPVMLPVLIARIIAEERVLRQLPAYVEYADCVRWRLIPGVW